MNEFEKFKFPQKVKRYNISKASLMLFVSKHENQIPWTDKINNESALENYISTVLLPNIFRASQYPVKKEEIKKSYFVEESHLDLSNFLNGIAAYPEDKIRKLHELAEREGESAAKVYLAEIINTAKVETFTAWWDFLSKNYKKDPAFIYMLIRSVFDTTPYGSRRVLDNPDKDVVAWLYFKIKNKRFNPQESLSKIYFLKKTFGEGMIIVNGWQHISSGSKNGAILSAAARRSGWCIAQISYARHYLASFGFYILRKSGKPVVALRIMNGEIYECRGVNNSVPNEYAHDIKVFTDYMNFKFDQNGGAVINNLSFDGFAEEWWNERIKFWPGCYYKMSDELKNKIKAPSIEKYIHYILFIPIKKIEADFNIKFGFDGFAQVLNLCPELYYMFSDLSGANGRADELKEACIAGWLSKIENGELTFQEYETLPNFVKESQPYKQLLQDQIQKKLFKELYRIKKSYKQRINKKSVEAILAFEEDEPFQVTVKRLTTLLFEQESSDFSDAIFPDDIKNKDNFLDLKKAAWAEAIEERPSFRLALDAAWLKMAEFAFCPQKVDPKQLKDALELIKLKPWLLDTKGNFPRQIRHKKEALLAYINGWQIRIKKNPERLWCVSNKAFGRREYLSYPALRNKQIIDTYYYEFLRALNRNSDIWEKLSPRTQDIPAIKMAFLMALNSCNNQKLKTTYFNAKSPLKRGLLSEPISVLNAKIIIQRASFCFQKFKENRLGEGLNFSDFS